MTYSIDAIKEFILAFDETSNKKTPSDLIDVVEKIRTEYERYNTSTSDKEKNEALSKIDIYMQEYDDLEWIFDNLKKNAATDVPKYEIKDYDYEDSQHPDIPIGDVIVDDMLEKVHVESSLRRHDNIMHQIIHETIGWWYDHYNSVLNVRQLILKNASGDYLDELASQYGFYRKDGETDDELKERIRKHMLEVFRKDFICNQANLKIFTKTGHGNPNENLTSTNTFLTNDYYIKGSDEDVEYWSNKYLTWRDIIWL